MASPREDRFQDAGDPPPHESAGREPSLVVLLGAGRPYRGRIPSGLLETPDHRHVLDWIIDAFSRARTDFHFVGGYHIDEVVERYPQLRYSMNADWARTGSAGSLLLAPFSKSRELFVCYTDIVFRRDLVDRLSLARGDVVLAVDRNWRKRYESRSTSDLRAAEKVVIENGVVTKVGARIAVEAASAEYIGVAKLSPEALANVAELRESHGESLRRQQLPELFTHLIEAGLRVRAVDVGAQWAELNAPQDLSRFVLGTKAETLGRLRSLVRLSTVSDQVSFTVHQWRIDPGWWQERILHAFGDSELIVRSSALTEDGWTTANASAFLSVLHVDAGDSGALSAAIGQVIASYGDDNPKHQILVQPMIDDVRVSGVTMTRTLSSGGPYYTTNYDDTTQSTSSVTGGTGLELKTVIVHRDVDEFPETANPLLGGLLPALKEIEALVGHDSLDAEFAITSGGTIHILQIRPIVVDHSHWTGSDDLVRQMLDKADAVFRNKQKSGPFIVGRTAIFGVMPDWNPAEIIGVRPRTLALDLYRYLVTDEVWATQRAQYGYRDVRPQPLMVVFAGHPYIDVRASFNSFVPRGLSNELAERLVNHYLDRLARNPQCHDKVEFDVVFTCLSFDFHEQATRLREAGFSAADTGDLYAGLQEITRNALGRRENDMADIHRLEHRCLEILKSDLPPLDRAFMLLDDCKRYGTLAFSHLARGAFVAVTLLRSAARVGILSDDEVSNFLRSISTIAKRFTDDASRVVEGDLEWTDLVERYGHLRPGTYEITSPSYAEDPERYLRPLLGKSVLDRGAEEIFQWSAQQRTRLAKELRELGLGDDVDEFDGFLRGVIEGREYAKFVFSRSLSLALECIAEFGRQHDLSKEALSHLALADFHTLRGGSASPDIGEWLAGRAAESAERYNLVQGIELPPLITRVEELRSFLLPESQPNFIGSGAITGPCVVLGEQADANLELTGRIVLIPQADPGFDWLFGHGVGGLITAYGGANSHMAIRAAEFGLPAAIGVGESLFEALSRARTVHLDCRQRRIQITE